MTPLTRLAFWSERAKLAVVLSHLWVVVVCLFDQGGFKGFLAFTHSCVSSDRFTQCLLFASLLLGELWISFDEVKSVNAPFLDYCFPHRKKIT